MQWLSFFASSLAVSACAQLMKQVCMCLCKIVLTLVDIDMQKNTPATGWSAFMYYRLLFNVKIISCFLLFLKKHQLTLKEKKKQSKGGKYGSR